MIEITHKQAQHLIRQGMDRRLPDEQWSALQAHLERCPDCTAYHAHLVTSERRLNHALHLRWGSARGPVGQIAEALLKRRRRAAQIRRFAKKYSWAALGLLLLFVYIGYRRLTAPPPTEPARSAAPRPTTAASFFEPTQPAVTFRGLAAFESRPDGNAEIFLLNASGGRADLTNLTQHPAADTHPAWSPDGEWLAFLSDRAGGKNELFVLTVAGSRLTQITSAPEIDWQGPLEWSPDGQTIALTGSRPGGPPFLYLVPLDGSTPRSIAYTRAAQPWTRFSPALPLLAYSSNTYPGGMKVVNLGTGDFAYLANMIPDFAPVSTAGSGAFDWALGGRSIVFVADGELLGVNGSLLRLSPDIDLSAPNVGIVTGAETIDRLPRPGAFRAVSWVPNSLQVAALHDIDEDGCVTLRINHAYNRQVAPRDFPELCVLGGLEHSNWVSGGTELLLVAREAPGVSAEPTEDADTPSTPGIYALRLENEQPVRRGEQKPPFERLVDLDPLTIQAITTGEPASQALRVRPTGRSLAITPRTAAALVGPSEPAAPRPTQLPPLETGSLPGMGSLPAWVYYDVPRGDGRQIFRARPDGSQPEPLTPDDRSASCPRVGPDGRLAYLMESASGSGGTGGGAQIYVTGPEGQPPLPLTERGGPAPDGYLDPDLYPNYNCPVWSPDGAYLAAYAYNSQGQYLAVIPADGSSMPTYVQLVMNGSAPYVMAEPVWIPGPASRRLLLAYPQDLQPARLMELDLEQLPEGELLVSDPGPALALRLVLTSWHGAHSLTFSPDGKQLAALMRYESSSGGPAIAQLRVFDGQSFSLLGVTPLNNFHPNYPGSRSLGWMADGSVGLARVTAQVGIHKTTFERFDWRTNDLDTLAAFEDIVTSAAWSDQGWVIFAAESGLWALPYEQDPPVPAQLNGEEVKDVEWR